MNTKPRIFVQLTEPSIGRPVLHIQREGEELQQFEIERDQLLLLNEQAVKIFINGQGK